MAGYPPVLVSGVSGVAASWVACALLGGRGVGSLHRLGYRPIPNEYVFKALNFLALKSIHHVIGPSVPKERTTVKIVEVLAIDHKVLARPHRVVCHSGPNGGGKLGVKPTNHTLEFSSVVPDLPA